MKGNIFLSIMLIITVFFAGCESFIDIQPLQSVSEETALSTDANVKSLLQGAYSLFNNPEVYGGGILSNAELLGGDGEIDLLNKEPNYEPYQIFSKNIPASSSVILSQWVGSYRIINAVNNVLEAINVVKESDRGWVKGEALFLRALTYFDLVRFFALPYEAGQMNNQPGVPLVLKPVRLINQEVFQGRATVETVYNQIITDLSDAAGILPDYNGIYPGQITAIALLARVYLQMGEFEGARQAADYVISSGLYRLETDYQNIFNRLTPGSEDIFAVKINYPEEYNALAMTFSSSDYGFFGFTEILEGHLKHYSPGDKRLDLFYSGDGVIRCGKWKYADGCVNLLRLAEMYLIRAECNIRLGVPYVGADPADDFNVIHMRAGFPPVSVVTLDEILLERRLELAFEGNRIHDLRRLREYAGTFPYNSPRLVFPIPARELEVNPGLTGQQNPGY